VTLALPALVTFGPQFVEQRKIHDPIDTDGRQFLVHVAGHANEILHRIFRRIQGRLGVGVQILVREVEDVGVVGVEQSRQRRMVPSRLSII